MNYLEMSQSGLSEEQSKAQEQYNAFQALGLKLNMARGKPCPDQLDLSEPMLKAISCNTECFTDKGFDCRNYGLVDGLDDAKALFGDLLGLPANQIIVGGNSSLNLMYDAVVRCLLYGVAGGNGPWIKQGQIKFLCPSPGYDRHFKICESLGIEMVIVDMTQTGPDMDQVEAFVKDPSVKGIWCVPKYSNPDGVTYSDETVKRFASLCPASPDFRIFWDNAYAVHDLYDQADMLLNLYEECVKCGNENIPFLFASTSKITYPGSGVSVIGASAANIAFIKEIMEVQTIGHDKMNMLRHVRYFGSAEGVRAYMKKHAAILRPKFEMVDQIFTQHLAGTGLAEWTKPRGGYFVSLYVLPGCAKRTAELAKQAGVVLTGAGATYPYGIDPKDANLRIAPTYPSLDELEKALNILCVCIKLAGIEKLLEHKA